MKEAFSTKLSPRRARWVKKQGLAFGSVSTVIENCVGMVMFLIENGIVRWDLETLQRVNEENEFREMQEKNERNGSNESFQREFPAAKTSPPKSLLRGDVAEAERPGLRGSRPLRCISINRRQTAWARAKACEFTPFRFIFAMRLA